MERRERMNDLQVAVQAALDGLQARMWTALPARVQSFNAAKATVVAQPTIQPQVRQTDGTWKSVTLPVCTDCPVIFPSGGGMTLTFPLAAGDEGLLVFASRCIDAWWQQSGVQAQATTRMHDLSDGLFIPGGFSVPRVPANIPTNAVELRNADRSARIRVRADTGAVTIVSPAGITLQGPITLQGAISLNGAVTLGGTVSGAGGGAAQFTGDVQLTAGTLVTAGDVRATGAVVAANGLPTQVGLLTHTHPSNGSPPTPGT
jgi:protein gp138